MFIPVTRVGGHVLRVSAAAIMYISETPGASVVCLCSGEHLMIQEDRAYVEQMVVEALAPPVSEVVIGEAVTASPITCSIDDAQLTAILDHLVRYGVGGPASLRTVIDEALADAALAKADHAGIAAEMDKLATRRGRGNRA